jgi:hypothetical protein
VEPTQVACHTLPASSWQVDCVDNELPGPPPPIPEQPIKVPGVGLGIIGHTLAGEHVVAVEAPVVPVRTVGPRAGPPMMVGGPIGDEIAGGPASARHAAQVCSCAWHPGKIIPEPAQVGCTEPAHRRKSASAALHDGYVLLVLAQ